MTENITQTCSLLPLPSMIWTKVQSIWKSIHCCFLCFCQEIRTMRLFSMRKKVGRFDHKNLSASDWIHFCTWLCTQHLDFMEFSAPPTHVRMRVNEQSGFMWLYRKCEARKRAKEKKFVRDTSVFVHWCDAINYICFSNIFLGMECQWMSI